MLTALCHVASCGKSLFVSFNWFSENLRITILKTNTQSNLITDGPSDVFFARYDTDVYNILTSFKSSKTPAGSNLGEYYQIL